MGTSGSVEIHYLYITECIVLSAVYVLVKCLINQSSACCYHVLDEPAEYTQTGYLTNGNNFSVGEKPFSVVLFGCKINECPLYFLLLLHETISRNLEESQAMDCFHFPKRVAQYILKGSFN